MKGNALLRTMHAQLAQVTTAVAGAVAGVVDALTGATLLVVVFARPGRLKNRESGPAERRAAEPRRAAAVRRRRESFMAEHWVSIRCAVRDAPLSTGTTPRTRKTLEKFSAGFLPVGVI